MSVHEMDLSPWSHGGFARFPDAADDYCSVGLSFVAPFDEETDRRGRTIQKPIPATVRLTGPIGGLAAGLGPERLRLEAQRLFAAADALEAIREARPPARTTLLDAG